MRRERVGHVGTPLRARQISLAIDPRPSAQHRDQRDGPRQRELRGECLGRCVAALQPAVAIARDERDRVDRWLRDARDDELCGDRREVAPATLLPRGDKRAGAALVDEGSPRRGKREAPTVAFGTAANGPGAGSAATFAPRWCAPNEPERAGLAHGSPDPAADAAPARQDEVEQLHPPMLEHGSCRIRDASVPDLCRVAGPAPSPRSRVTIPRYGESRSGKNTPDSDLVTHAIQGQGSGSLT